jgi:hypothetical protein
MWDITYPTLFRQSAYRRIPYSEISRHVTLVRTDVSEELTASIIRVTRISEQKRLPSVDTDG